MTKWILSPLPSSQHIFGVYWARKLRLVSKCSVLFILQNPLPNGQYFREHDWKVVLSFDMEREADFMLICNLTKMRFWNFLHFTPQIIFQNQSVFEKENVNELSFSQIIDEGSMRTNLVTILKYFLTVRGDHPEMIRKLIDQVILHLKSVLNFKVMNTRLSANSWILPSTI